MPNKCSIPPLQVESYWYHFLSLSMDTSRHSSPPGQSALLRDWASGQGPLLSHRLASQVLLLLFPLVNFTDSSHILRHSCNEKILSVLSIHLSICLSRSHFVIVNLLKSWSFLVELFEPHQTHPSAGIRVLLWRSEPRRHDVLLLAHAPWLPAPRPRARPLTPLRHTCFLHRIVKRCSWGISNDS